MSRLKIGGATAAELAKEYGTPLYVVDETTLRDNCRRYTDTLKTHYPDFLVAYAGKANLNIGLLDILASEGLGVDVVSGGELYTALKSRVRPETIVFHGNNKSIEELEFALKSGIRVVADNPQEIETIIKLNLEARVMLRLKPEIEAHTHDYIKTGHIDSKFGIDKRDYLAIVKELKKHSKIEFLGLHSHIGSQIFDVQPYEDLVQIMVGHMEEVGGVKELNLGGGLGIRYIKDDDPPAIEEVVSKMALALKAACKTKNIPLPKLILEPGRSIVGSAGTTLYTVGAIKPVPGIKEYLFVDGGMADNIRPMMYQAKYTFALADKMDQPAKKSYAIAGKYCESGDVLAENVPLPEAAVGDVVAVFGTGAYNYSMASNYNRSCKPAMVVVNEGKSRVLVRRETMEDLIRCDLLT